MKMNSTPCNTMSFSKYLMSLQEGYDESIFESKDIEMPVDESGFDDGVFGVDKMERPSEEGFEAARKAANAFTNASDGENTDVDMNMNIALPKDTSGFNESFDVEGCEGENCNNNVDPNTIPAIPEEKDQFSEPSDGEAAVGSVSDAELASDDDDIIGEGSFEESATGWDDLF